MNERPYLIVSVEVNGLEGQGTLRRTSLIYALSEKDAAAAVMAAYPGTTRVQSATFLAARIGGELTPRLMPMPPE